MFTHIMIGTDDVQAAKGFYDAVLGALGYGEGTLLNDGRGVGYSNGTGFFAAVIPRDGNAASFANGGTIGFAAATPEAVTAAHSAGLANGGTCEGEPGPREMFPGAYGAYLRDATGNKICLWHTAQV
jgi:catechol 2,3-dioxygenase-like lactoylglutathione lyase family enzyme